MRNIVILSFVLLFSFLSGCQSSSDESTASILIINGEKYYGQEVVEKDKYAIQNQIGEVKSKADADRMPQKDYSSNTLKVGTQIYSVVEKDNIILVKTPDEKYQIFSKNISE